jgi:hypothetical protein
MESGISIITSTTPFKDVIQMTVFLVIPLYTRGSALLPNSNFFLHVILIFILFFCF